MGTDSPFSRDAEHVSLLESFVCPEFLESDLSNEIFTCEFRLGDVLLVLFLRFFDECRLARLGLDIDC